MPRSRTLLAALALLATPACTLSDLEQIVGPALSDLSASTGPGGAPAAPAASSGPVAPLGTRSLSDRPDEAEGPQIHVIYAVPSDRPDRSRDLDGLIARSIAHNQSWFKAESGGLALRFDTYGGQLDVSCLKLAESSRALGADNDALLDNLVAAGRKAGFDDAHKIYLYYYDGPSVDHELVGLAGQGQGAMVFMQEYETERGEPALGQAALSNNDLTALHELTHALGHVLEDAPHYADGGHVDTPYDLMSASEDGEQPLKLDPGHDDYFGQAGERLDLSRAVFLAPAPPNFQPIDGYRLSSRPAPGAVSLAPLIPGVSGERAAQEAAIQKAASTHWSLPVEAGLNALARDLATRSAAGEDEPSLGGLEQAFIAVEDYRYRTYTLEGGAGLAPAALASALQARLAAASLEKANAMGAGVAYDGADAVVAVLEAHALVQLENVALGEGPFGVRTLSGHARALDRQGVTALGVSTGSHEWPYRLGRFGGSAGLDFVADVPGAGTPTLRFWFADAAGELAHYEHDLAFDARAPLASSLRPSAAGYRLAAARAPRPRHYR